MQAQIADIKTELERIDLGKLVLVHEFFDAVVRPLSKEQELLDTVFGVNGGKIGLKLAALEREDTAEIRFVSAESVESDQTEKRGVEPYVSIISEAKMFNDIGQTLMGEDRHYDPFPNVRGERNVIGDTVHDRGLPATYLGNVVTAMQMCRGLVLGSGLARYNLRSVMNGEGAMAKEFWQRVNALDSYNHLSNEPPPTRWHGASVSVVGIRQRNLSRNHMMS